MANRKQEKQSFFSKLENFWYYYKTPVILAAAFIFILSVVICQNLQSVKTDLNIALVSVDVLNEGNINFEEKLAAQMIDSDQNGEKHITLTRIFLNPKSTDENTESTRLHLESLLADKGAVLFIFDKENFEYIMTKDAFCPLDALMDTAAYGDKVYKRNEVPVALHLAGSTLLKDMGFTNDDLYATVLFKRDEDAQNQVLAAQYENGITVLKELMQAQ